MPPRVASIVFVIGILGLFWLNRDSDSRTSPALWIPVIWLAIVCSRAVGQWLHMGAPIDTVGQVMDGSPVDRLVYAILLGAGVMVLVTRAPQVGRLLRDNGPIVFFFLFCALTLLWSDFPGIAFKRWIKASGDVVMVLVVLTERDRIVAVKRLLARLAFVLVPLSILFIKYYPELGRQYGLWNGQPIYTGVTTNKNTLGVTCLCFGLGALWSFVALYKDREAAGRTRRMLAHGVILGMVLRLFQLMNSMTSLSCFLMASVLLLATNLRLVRRRPAILHLAIAAMLGISFSVLFLDISPDVLYAMGRNPTLTERTDLWGVLLSHAQNPLLGTGFESFWLGPRLQEIWRVEPWRPNEAHNGYLEIYLNLGWIGVAFLTVVIAAGYRTVFRAWRANDPAGSLRLAYFFAGLVFNFTEAAFFKMQAAAWIFFLFAIVSVTAVTERELRPTAPTLRERSGPLTHELAPSTLSEEVV
jgi:exopolysaccharide production protein ExoQ